MFGVRENDITLATRHRKLYKRDDCCIIMASRARSTTHVEYEIINYLGTSMYLDDLMSQMIPEGDDVAAKRFKKGAENICKFLENMAGRRLHKLPKTHPAYLPKEDE